MHIRREPRLWPILAVLLALVLVAAPLVSARTLHTEDSGEKQMSARAGEFGPPMHPPSREVKRPLRGTWSSGSRQVLTGMEKGVGFFNPIRQQFTVPPTAGISYSFTDDGYFEEAIFKYGSNAVKPECFNVTLVWQHGTYNATPDGKLHLNAYQKDGYVETMSNCTDPKIVMAPYSENELMLNHTTFIETAPMYGAKGVEASYGLQLNQFDGTPLSKMYLVYDPPRMMPVKQLFMSVIGGMSRTVQQLIVEVLKARPSARDSASYLSAFGTRPGAPRAPVWRMHARADGHRTQGFDGHGAGLLAHGLPSVPPAASGSWDSALVRDSPGVADHVAEDEPVRPLAESHPALVKIQGPFTDRQLQSISEGIQYLRQLGLICVVVLDHERWHPLSQFAADGRRVDADATELAPWLGPGAQFAEDQGVCIGAREIGLRHTMIRELWRVANTLHASGADPRPFPHAMVHVAPAASLPPSHFFPAQGERVRRERTPLAADSMLEAVYSALSQGQIPVIMPVALYDDVGVLRDGDPLRNVCVPADDVMVALARDMANVGWEDAAAAEAGGGIPSHARGGNPHLSINLASEYDRIRSSFVWDETHPAALGNLEMVRDCLAYMPAASSSVMVTHRSPKSLIGNLITNKAAHSPSLPNGRLANRKDAQHTPTVIRTGLPVRVLQRVEQLDMDRLQALLEASFGRTLDRDAYCARLQTHLDFAIITGDYDGLAVVTREYAPADDPAFAEPIAYLDKFAVLPKLQGSGAVDFLWGALRDEVQGLGLLDALNDNGGKGGFGVARDLVWKSRADNPINRWYAERSSGFMRLPPFPGAAPGTPDWVMFWCDAELRLAQLAGQVVHPATAQLDDVRAAASLRAHRDEHKLYGLLRPSMPHDVVLPVIAPDECGRLLRWAQCLESIPSAWRG
ncbi:amino-acid N-acetyltransferase [Malassezia sp. CBS 17886]|nr:amino-acid N-acetyltransferase [Malassezia sp. CBS 17886]